MGQIQIEFLYTDSEHIVFLFFRARAASAPLSFDSHTASINAMMNNQVHDTRNCDRAESVPYL